MTPASRRRGALALLALAGCGVAQNMGQWVGGEHCAGSHCGPGKEEAKRCEHPAGAGAHGGAAAVDVHAGAARDDAPTPLSVRCPRRR